MLFACMDPVILAATKTREIREIHGVGSHGDELETSAIMYAFPDLVRPERFVFSHGIYMQSRFVPTDPFAGCDKVIYYSGVEEQAQLAPSGHVGDPTRASREKGEALYTAVVDNGSEFIEDLRRHARSGCRVLGATGQEAESLLRRERSS